MSYEFQFLIVAIVFTVIGWSWGLQHSAKRAIEIVINNLIDNDYIKTKIDENGDTEIMKYWERE